MTAAIVFDLDDTLYPERDYVYSGFAAVAAAFAAKAAAFADLEARLRDQFNADPGGPTFDVVVRSLMPDASRSLVEEMLDVYRAHRPTLQLFDDAADCLAACRRYGKLGLITDGRLEGQQAKLDALEIAPKFDCIVMTDQWGKEFWKPHPQAYEHVEGELGCPPARCVYIADNLRKDFVTPNVRGWRSVRVERPHALTLGRPTAPGGEPQHTIRSLRELPPLLETWFGR